MEHEHRADINKEAKYGKTILYYSMLVKVEMKI
jgi:hypothetical protein